MKSIAFSLALLSLAGIAGCVDGGYRRYPRERVYAHEHYDDAWDVVRSDPCRLDEYRRFAADHKNPEKRRRFIERLAREGCSDRQRPTYGRYSYDDAWDIVRRDPCRLDEYRRFAAEHKSPEKRRQFVERLAREGCSSRYDRYD